MHSKILTKDFEKYDCYILSSSIVCCEAEIRTINEIKSKTNKNIFVIGPFATNNPKKYIDAGAIVISGEPEFYFLKQKNFFLENEKKKIKFKN